MWWQLMFIVILTIIPSSLFVSPDKPPKSRNQVSALLESRTSLFPATYFSQYLKSIHDTVSLVMVPKLSKASTIQPHFHSFQIKKKMLLHSSSVKKGKIDKHFASLFIKAVPIRRSINNDSALKELLKTLKLRQNGCRM